MEFQIHGGHFLSAVFMDSKRGCLDTSAEDLCVLYYYLFNIESASLAEEEDDEPFFLTEQNGQFASFYRGTFRSE